MALSDISLDAGWLAKLSTASNAMSCNGRAKRLSCQFNSIGFERCMQFLESRAYFGGGLSFYTARKPSERSPTNSLCFVNCTWESNIARAGSAVDLSVWHPSTRGALVRVACECLIAAVLNATHKLVQQ